MMKYGQFFYNFTIGITLKQNQQYLGSRSEIFGLISQTS
jgi:hypothetical protein